MHRVSAQASALSSTACLINSTSALAHPRNGPHSLRNILLLALASVLCGATGWEEMEVIAEERAEALQDLLDRKSSLRPVVT